jgi:hypothetical protein
VRVAWPAGRLFGALVCQRFDGRTGRVIQADRDSGMCFVSFGPERVWFFHDELRSFNPHDPT